MLDSDSYIRTVNRIVERTLTVPYVHGFQTVDLHNHKWVTVGRPMVPVVGSTMSDNKPYLNGIFRVVF